ncbi:iron-siderophore ABC transporter substrate-binding protein [Rubrobacter taiwanensis]|jgi:iron complex transport system substrate-binding protein|uniref:Iron-siderophore ABC transporter substrate-binding protein n=1 Tax=Rubrobacter taiwanensis TaxID=185139 RepID=A0A4R1B650_9ACTN|nr:iron-siderophore ABC transporter substrate-binding protein [Rubrobacter taiwanensis]TCJ13070.1 iron-siderophore ABC transporter substrate-binding protein [Rubrobacter taiwanensis]
MTKEAAERVRTFPSLPEIDDVTRREFLIGAAGLLLLPAGCSRGAVGGGGADARTIEHKYGETVVEGVPERVVSVGYTDQDPLLALGVRPVGIRRWFGDPPNGVWPWAQGELGDAKPELLPADAINYEQVAALEPDLIVGISSGMTRNDYDTLSEFAPTLPQSGEWVDYGVPWQEQTRIIGRALGREERAGELVSDLERRFEQAWEEYPEFEGATVTVIGAGGGFFYLYSEADRSVRFFTDLGLRLPGRAAEVATEDDYYVEISEEQFGLAEADVIICFSASPADEEEIRSHELFRRLDAVREDRVVYLTENDDPLKGALSFNTVLSHPYLLENFAPRLAQIVRRARSNGRAANG